MDLYHAHGTAKSRRAGAHIECGQCGEPLFMPEWSELVDEHHVRHLWECAACGYAFETSVQVRGSRLTHAIFTRTAAGAAAILRAMIDRRHLLLGAAVALAPRLAQAASMSRVTAYAFTFKGLDGNEILLSSFAGHPILVVNTASLCGYTPQYTGLQALWTRYRDKGLMVLGVPSNDFGGQEPGGKAEIVKTAQGDYHVTFPLTEKAAVKGTGRPSVLPLGGGRAPARGAALELPQIPDRPRRPAGRRLHLRRRAERSAADRGDRDGN